MKTIYSNDNDKIYFKFKSNNESDNNYPLPYVSFILGVELDYNTWIDEKAFFRAEEGFVMYGDEYQEFLNSLKKQIDNYEEKQFEIYDYLIDTNGNLIIDCQKNTIILKGQLGSTLVEGLPVFKFTLRNLDLSFLINLYETLIKNTKF